MAKYTAESMRRYRKMFRKSKSEFMLKCTGKLNGDMPKSEQWFREKLEDYGYYKRFKKNRPIYHLEVIPDLLDMEYKIVIEVDGTIHNRPDVKARDEEKDRKYKAAGYTVFRVVHGDEEGAQKVLDGLYEIYGKPSPKQVRRANRKPPVQKQISKEEQVEAVQRIMGLKKSR